MRWGMRLAPAVAAAVLRASHLAGPYKAGLDSGFQEVLALSHVELGLSVTKALPTVGLLGDTAIHHTTHPPLLHLIYASGYTLFGFHEWIARGVTLAAFLASVILIGALVRRWTRALPGSEAQGLAASWLMALMPLSTRYGQTTAFGVVAVAFILAALLATERVQDQATGGNRAAMILLWTAALLTEWTAYLVFPLLLLRWLLHDRQRLGPGWAAYFIIHPVLVLVAYQGWAYLNTGTIELLGHAAVRTRPSTLADVEYWLYLLRELLGGAPAVLLIGLAIAVLRCRGARKKSLAWLPLLYPLLYVLLAPQLVHQHPFELYNFAPLLAIAGGLWAARLAAPLGWGLVAAGTLHGAAVAAFEKQEANSFFYNLSYALDTWAKPGQAIYTTAAVGQFKLYTPLRVHYALGANMPPLDEFLVRQRPEWVWLDQGNMDVTPEANALRRLVNEWAPQLRFAHGTLYRRADLSNPTGQADGLALRLQEARWDHPADVKDYMRPETVLIEDTLEGMGVFYGIVQHPPAPGATSRLTWPPILVEPGSILRLGFGLDPSQFDPAKGDGVTFRILVNGTTLLGRALDPKNRKSDRRWVILDVDLSNYAGQEISLGLETDAMRNAAYDRCYWLDPRVIRPKKEQP